MRSAAFPPPVSTCLGSASPHPAAAVRRPLFKVGRARKPRLKSLLAGGLRPDLVRPRVARALGESALGFGGGSSHSAGTLSPTVPGILLRLNWKEHHATSTRSKSPARRYGRRDRLSGRDSGHRNTRRRHCGPVRGHRNAPPSRRHAFDALCQGRHDSAGANHHPRGNRRPGGAALRRVWRRRTCQG